METTLDELRGLMAEIEADRAKFFEKQQKAAGRRMRKNAMDAKKLLHQFRKELTEEINLL